MIQAGVDVFRNYFFSMQITEDVAECVKMNRELNEERNTNVSILRYLQVLTVELVMAGEVVVAPGDTNNLLYWKHLKELPSAFI